MAWDCQVWMDVQLDGTVSALHVRWYENGELMRHDERFDQPLDEHEAASLLEFVLGTS